MPDREQIARLVRRAEAAEAEVRRLTAQNARLATKIDKVIGLTRRWSGDNHDAHCPGWVVNIRAGARSRRVRPIADGRRHADRRKRRRMNEFGSEIAEVLAEAFLNDSAVNSGRS